MKYFKIEPVIDLCDRALQLFSQNTDRVADQLFLGQYSGPNDKGEIRRAMGELDILFGASLEQKIVTWTEDKVNISDILKLNLSDSEASLLAFRLENARDNIPRLLGVEGDPPTYELGIQAAAESIAVQWALTVFWSLTRDVYLDYEALYISDVLSGGWD